MILAVAIYIKRRKKKLQEQDNEEIEASEDPVYAAELREVTTPVYFICEISLKIQYSQIANRGSSELTNSSPYRPLTASTNDLALVPEDTKKKGDYPSYINE